MHSVTLPTHTRGREHSHGISDEEDDWHGDGQVKVSPVPQQERNAGQQHVTQGEGNREHDAYHASVPHAARLHRYGHEAENR